MTRNDTWLRGKRRLVIGAALAWLSMATIVAAQDEGAPEPEQNAPEPEQNAPEPEQSAPEPEQNAPEPEHDAPETVPDDDAPMEMAPIEEDWSDTTSSKPAEETDREARFRFEGQGMALAVVTAPDATMHSTSDTWGRGAHIVRNPEHYRILCTSPCTGTLPAGIHTFGLRGPDGAVRVALPPLSLGEDQTTRIEGHLVDGSGARDAAIPVAVVGVLVGLGGSIGFMALGLLQEMDLTAALSLAAGSFVLGIASLALGLDLRTHSDRTWVVGRSTAE